MKISYRTHSILKKLEEKKLGIIGLNEEDAGLRDQEQIISEMRQNFKNYAPYFSKNIRIITKPFAEAVDLARPKMIVDELFKLDEFESGTIFLPTGLTFMYYFSPFSILSGNNGDHIFFTFQNEVLVGYSRQKANAELGLFCFVSKALVNLYSNKLSKHGLQNQKQVILELDSQFSTLIITIINFIKYCPIETVHLGPRFKSNNFHCKYVNDTGCHIDVLDSKWFTTLVKSDAFKVRGHFRLQPCGEGLKDRKLIWINDFVKEGYTAPARKLSNT